MRLFAFILFSILSTGMISGQVQLKAIDGLFEDWNDSDFSVDDAFDNQGLDILKVSIANDRDRLYLLVETDREFDLQDEEDLTIFIDTDNNPATGFPRGGIGAEITYYFGAKNGFLNGSNGSINVNHSALGAIGLPTVTSEKFELVFDREVSAGGSSAIMASTIAIHVENDSTGDLVPNNGGGIVYNMSDTPNLVLDYDLTKNPSHTRFMTYNVLRDGFLDNGQKGALEDVLKGINPDIIAFQEIYDQDLADLLDLLNVILPNPDGTLWQGSKVFPDVIVCTRYFMEAFDKIDGNGVFLTYLDDNSPIIIYNVHLPCCANDQDRQQEIDRILSVVRDKEDAPETGFSYPDDTPVIITGDFNMVGQSQNYTSFIEGDIVNNNAYGEDFAPDWDGSNLEDANPYITGYPSNYTWNSPGGSYNPGKLDFIFYTGSVMGQQNSFVLDTEKLNSTELNQLGLNANSTTLASDHLPVVVDFTFGVVIDQDGDGYSAEEDCDDNNAAINIGATEIPNNSIDEDCDGIALVIDLDMDGYNSDEDCDDASANINPGATEIPNNLIDEDCDGIALVIDEDMDGYNSDVDCDDNSADVNPGQVEIPNNSIDEDCNGIAEVIDQDGDGFNSDDDCDDNNPGVNPNQTEIINNNIDEDCDGEALMIDEDGDGYNSDVDCDDTNPEINPGVMEIPNNMIDEDCDGQDAIVDADMDGYNSNEDCDDGDAMINPAAMEIPNNDIDEDCDGDALIIDEDMDGYNSDEDCDDASANVNPGAIEIPNNDIDEDCNGEVLIIDFDNDGFNSDEDCDDGNPDIYPMAPEVPDNGIDEDCNGEDLSTGIFEIDGITVKLFPNPVHDHMFIEINRPIEYSIKIFDAQGKLQQQFINMKGRAELDLSDLPQGMYMLNIESKEQKMLRFTDRIIVL